MMQRLSIVAIILAALGVHVRNVQAQNSQVERAFRSHTSGGYGDSIGDVAPTPNRTASNRSAQQGLWQTHAQPAGFASSMLNWSGRSSGCCDGCDGGDCDGGCDGGGYMSACGIDWCNDGCGQWWVDLEVVQFYLKGRSLPPLVTTSTDPLDEGVLGRPTTQVIFGDDTIGSQRQTGGRVTIGKWLDPQSTLGIGAKFFGMEGDRTSFSAASTGTTVIARPFFNADPIVNAEDSFLISAPGIASGTLNIQTSSDLINAEAYVRYLLLEGGNYRLDAIGGYHFNRLDDGLVIRHSSTSLPPNGPPPIGSTFDVQDVFETTNEFHGGELGLLGEWHCGCVTVSLLGKVSLGNIRQQVAISGSSLVSDGAGGTVNYVGGLLAQPQDNIGVFQHDETGFIPEVGLNLSYALTQHIDVTVGYTFMHWNSVALAGDQIDTTVNASQLSGGTLVGPVRPTFAEFQETSFFLHGINVGIGGRF